MTSLYDAPAKDVIEELTETLQTESALDEPEWLQYTTTGVDRELPPEQEDFWARRAASILRKVAIDGPVGVGTLESEYGDAKQGTTRYRVRPRQTSGGSGSIIRTILQQLEEAGYVEVAEGEGRAVTPDGHSLLDETAADVLESIDNPDLQRYA
ncbi:SSU ribosomal protein S19E [Halovenus aranensis]|uniref:Small ribosomal subunit protein eS19 n=1 Tax=Halovenus aranensis TaxID=890420 RepID=A0A1G8RZL6_9EURY|nr:30S ribosomal protein S19e [Halovenus aranensis]SDJ21975.1 SSU ribosomal protein S19E [Halovenus aranensis]